MKTTDTLTGLALAGLALTLLPATAWATPAKPHSAMKAHKGAKMAVATTYECSKCHMKYTAAQAKKDGYKDPMDGGKLVPVKTAHK